MLFLPILSKLYQGSKPADWANHLDVDACTLPSRYYSTLRLKAFTEVDRLYIDPVGLTNVLADLVATVRLSFLDVAVEFKAYLFVLKLILSLGLHIADKVYQPFESDALLFYLPKILLLKSKVRNPVLNHCSMASNIFCLISIAVL
jgi:hypothetical protein